MSRVSAALATALGTDPVSLVALVKLEFDSGTVRLHTGIGDLVYGGENYEGAGGLLSLNFPSETAEVRATGGTIALSGLDPSILAIADTENYQGRRATVFFGAFDSAGALVVDPDTIYRGTMDVMEPVDEGETARIALSIENRAAAFDRPNVRRLTPEDQALLYAGDKGFDFVAALQDRTIIWGPQP